MAPRPKWFRNDIYAVLDEHQPGDMVKVAAHDTNVIECFAQFAQMCDKLKPQLLQVRLLRPDKPEELGTS